MTTFYGTFSNLGYFVFPSDIIQYVARALTVVFFIYFVYKRDIRLERIIHSLLNIYIIGMLIGILQWLPWSGREIFIMLYPFRDGHLQLSHLYRDLSGIRVHGVAQHATANGGVATFFFVFGLSVFRYYNKYKLKSVILIVLTIVNIFAGQSRAGILSLFSSFFILYVAENYMNKKKTKNTLKLLFIIVIISATVFWLYKQGNPFVLKMVFRWINLVDNQGGGRIDQINYFMTFFDTPFDYIFGLSKPFVNNSAISYGVEIEPVNIFVNYGLLGFFLQYSLVVYLAYYFFRNIKQVKNNKELMILTVSSFVGLLSYQVFSIAYFFFREIRVGLYPWIFIGIAIGAYEKYKNPHHSLENQEKINEEVQLWKKT